MPDSINASLEQEFPLDQCHVCGKRFYKTPEWAYKLCYHSKTRFMCSYTCFRTLERKRQAEQRPIIKRKELVKMNNRQLTDKDILRLWRQRSGPVNLKQDLDPDISFPCIDLVEFGLNDKNEPYIVSITLPDPHGRSFIKASPAQIYTGVLLKKFTDNYQ